MSREMCSATHDLLRLADVAALLSDAPLPEWAEDSLCRAPWVVVCRRPRRGRLLPVGVRGRARHERHLAWLPMEAVAERVTPEMLAGRRGWRSHARSATVPALSALEQASMILEKIGLSWGPAGSVAYELATGQPALTSASDLDLVLRPAMPWSREAARKIHAALAESPVRLDVLLETVDGGLSLAELAGNTADVVLRTPDGARRMVVPT